MNQFAGELALVLLVVGITLLGVITYLKNQSLKLNRAILATLPSQSPSESRCFGFYRPGLGYFRGSSPNGVGRLS